MAGAAPDQPTSPCHTLSDAAVSTRHLSCIETGKAKPSRELLLHIPDQLAAPRRNHLLLVAGLAPQYPARHLKTWSARQSPEEFGHRQTLAWPAKGKSCIGPEFRKGVHEWSLRWRRSRS